MILDFSFILRIREMIKREFVRTFLVSRSKFPFFILINGENSGRLKYPRVLNCDQWLKMENLVSTFGISIENYTLDYLYITIGNKTEITFYIPQGGLSNQ
jgi:hypothetical protein